jgi:hypothetical protein
MKSKFFNLNLKDFLKGSIVAVLTALGTFLGSVSNADLASIGKAAIIAFLAYLVKNLFTNSDGQILKIETPQTPVTDGK